MAPQLQLNQGPQDALLYDNSRSYFTNVGYTRTSNFQMELRDVDPQNTANLGATVNFVIPKAADLLGPCDLMIEFNKSTVAPGSTGHVWGWVESVGHAMLEKVTFSIGSHDVEVLTGEHLNILNELMRTDTHRYGFKKIGKTGRPLIRSEAAGTAHTLTVESSTDADAYDRIIAYDSTVKDGKKLIIPLGLFFMKHPSAYFPLAAIAGCNDVRISIKFRTANELVMGYSPYTVAAGVVQDTAPADAFAAQKLVFENSTAFKRCQLRCHYVHVTGPEATALMNREHVRLMKLWNGNEVVKQFKVTGDATNQTFDIDLSFLHPVQEIVITIRKVSEMGSTLSTTAAQTTQDQGARTKNYFAYHGGGRDSLCGA